MTIAPTRSEQYGRSHLYIWANLLTADGVGLPISAPGSADASVHVFGTFGGSAVTIEGSNEVTPTNWVTLNDPIGDPLSFAAAGIQSIAENPLHIRAVLTGGTSADVSVHILKRNTI